MKYLLTFFQNNKYLKAFTLLETLVSIEIITIAVIGPLALITTSSSYARQTKDAMLASFLVQEALELVQNRYDSLYVLCTKQPGISPCITETGEISSQIAWRVFKQGFSATSTYPSCYLDENASGCAYDYLDMMESEASPPPRYLSTSSECSTLVGMASTSVYSYVCKGLPSHQTGTLTNVTYKRVVYLELLPTFESGPMAEQYNDDMRVTVEVFYKSANGVTRSVKVARFIHPRP